VGAALPRRQPRAPQARAFEGYVLSTDLVERHGLLSFSGTGGSTTGLSATGAWVGPQPVMLKSTRADEGGRPQKPRRRSRTRHTNGLPRYCAVIADGRPDAGAKPAISKSRWRIFRRSTRWLSARQWWARREAAWLRPHAT